MTVMRTWVMQFHMYGGLLFFGFLMVFALSSLTFNHRPAWMDGKISTSWTQTIATPVQVDPWAYGAAVQEALGLAGRLLHPTFAKATNDMDFEVSAPGRRYRVHVSGGSARIDEDRAGWAATVAQMHGVRPATSSLVLKSWAWYSVIGSLVLTGSTLTGIFLWMVRPRERKLGWVVLIGATAVSLGICTYIRAWG